MLIHFYPSSLGYDMLNSALLLKFCLTRPKTASLIKNKLEQTDRDQRGQGNNGGKEGEGLVKACVNDPSTWTTVWESAVGAGGRVVGSKGINWDNCHRITIKNLKTIGQRNVFFA